MSDRKPMDCGDNSCQYEGRSRGGMRTNGGCYCLKDLDFDKRMRAQEYIRHLEAEVERLRSVLGEVECWAATDLKEHGPGPLGGYELRLSTVRAALRGGGEHSKHPTGDYCVYCLSQWPCEDSLRGGGE